MARPEITIDERAAPLARPVFRFLLKHGRKLDRLQSASARHRAVNRFLIGERNIVAVAEALRVLPDHDVALVWGAAHVPGMGRLLRRRGFRLRGERWLSVLSSTG